MMRYVVAAVALLGTFASAAPGIPAAASILPMNATSTASAPLVTREALVPRDEIPNEKLTWMDLMIDPFDTEDIRHSTKGFVAACLNDIFHPESGKSFVIGELTVGRTKDENWMSAFKNVKDRK